jgi:hypothetical protein
MTIQITNETQLLMASLLSRLKFTILDYKISPFLDNSNSNFSMKFSAENDEIEKILETAYDEQFFKDIFSIVGLDPNEELKRIVIAEIDEELSKWRKNK